MKFSALRFLEDQPQPRRGPVRLRDALLFAVRALALLLLAGAFAWPYIHDANVLPIRESRVYILDNTLSHQANDGFARDLDRAIREIEETRGGLQVAVIELTSTPKTVVAFGDDRAAAVGRLKELKPSFQRGSYLAAFRQANSLLANSLGDQKRIVLLGDSQENQWTENTSSPPFLRQVQVELPRPPAGRLPNLSLADPRTQRVFLGDKTLVHFSVKLTHVGEARTAGVIVRANGQVVLNRRVDLENEPETILIQAQWESEPGSWIRGEAEVEGTPDALRADNRVFFSLAPVVEGRVGLLAQSPYLRLALSPEVMRGQWFARVIEPAALAEEAAVGQDADVLCLESAYLQSAEVRKVLWRYLTNGRGVILFVNRVSPVIKESLRELGFEVQNEDSPGSQSPEKFQFVLSNHRIFHPFLSPDYGNLMEVKVFDYVRLKPLQATPLIFSETGAGLFFEGTKFPGKLFVAAFGLDRDHTSWPIHQSFIPFLDLALQAARAEDPTPTSFEPGELAPIQLPADAATRDVVLREGNHEVVRVQVEQGRAQIRLPDAPGLYDLYFDERGEAAKVFSVNPSPKESQLAFSASPQALDAWQMKLTGSPAKFAGPSGRGKLRISAVLQQQFWWWMVLGGLAALTIETALAETRKGWR